MKFESTLCEEGELSPLSLKNFKLAAEFVSVTDLEILKDRLPALSEFLEQADVVVGSDETLPVFLQTLDEIGVLGRVFRYSLPYVEDYTFQQVQNFERKIMLIQTLIWRPWVGQNDPELSRVIERIQKNYRRFLRASGYLEFKHKFEQRALVFNF